MIQLREDQQQAVDDMRAALRDHQSILFRGPTGVGKTVIAAYMARASTEKRRRVIFGVHRRELAEQTAKTFDQFGIKYGFIAAGRPSNPFAMVQIASADTLRSRPGLLKGCKLFVPDESHLWASKTRSDLIHAARAEGSLIVGLTATPERLDGKPLDSLFDHMVQGPSESWLIENGHLSRYRAYAPVRPDFTGLHTQMGEYVTSELEEKFDKPAIHGDAIDAWRKYAAGKRTMVFAISRKHGQHVTDEYNAAGIPAVYIDGTISNEERRSRILKFANGQAMILVSINLAIEGFDLSAQVGRDVPVQCVQLLNPTKSKARARQMMGRALRKKPDEAIILDHVNMIMNKDGTVNHGFPDDEIEWSLEGRARNKAESAGELAIKQCESCFATYKSGLRACPYCSSERVVKERKVEQIEGELAEIQRAKEEGLIKKVARMEVGRTSDIEKLADIALARNYKTGWLISQAKIKKLEPITWNEACKLMFDAKARALKVAA